MAVSRQEEIWPKRQTTGPDGCGFGEGQALPSSGWLWHTVNMELYLVGGAVRDMLLGRTPTELDFAFSGDLEDFLSLHPDARRVGKSVHVCLWHGRECMPFRGAGPEEDLMARDLTINALALDKAGKLYMHPQAVNDLQQRILRPASPTAFADDPTRIFRLARFAAYWPDWRIDKSAFEQMRALSYAERAALPAERVGREVLKALAAPAPGRFFRVLAQGQSLAPWFSELEKADCIPAGPRQWHSNSVLGHSLRIMDTVAGDFLAVWMALCHDLGKILTDPALLPHHYGHEKNGVALSLELARRLRLSSRFAKAGVLAASEHMKGGMYTTLRPGTRRDLLWRVHTAGFDQSFWRLVDADSGSPISSTALAHLAVLLDVRLPKDWHNKGEASARKLRELHCQALAKQ